MKRIKDIDNEDLIAGLGVCCTLLYCKSCLIVVLKKTICFSAVEKKKTRSAAGYKLDGRDQIQDSKFTTNSSGKRELNFRIHHSNILLPIK